MDVKRTGIVLKPNNSRVLFRPFEPDNQERILKIIARVMSVSDREVSALLADVMREFQGRHQRLHTISWSDLKASGGTCLPTKRSARSGGCSSAPISRPNIRSNRQRSSIHRSFGTPTKPVCRRVHGDSCSACGPLAKGISPRSRFARAPSMRTTRLGSTTHAIRNYAACNPQSAVR